MGKPPYQNLLTYRYSVYICDLTDEFVREYLSGREHLRTREQMTQAARSGKQCIAEGATQGTSLKGYLKMLGVTRGSFEELLEDYKDIARRGGIHVLGRDEWGEERYRGWRGYRVFIQDKPTPPAPPIPLSPLPQDIGISVNVMIDLITRTNYLLDQQKKSLEEKFVNEGGYTENLFKKRLDQRTHDHTQ